jgi:hypothetical protein
MRLAMLPLQCIESFAMTSEILLFPVTVPHIHVLYSTTDNPAAGERLQRSQPRTDCGPVADAVAATAR